MEEQFNRTPPIGDSTVYARPVVMFEEIIWAPELRRAQTSEEPPKMVGSSKVNSTETVPEDPADKMTVVDLETGFRIIAAVPADERVID